MASPEADLLAHRRTTASHTIGVPYLSELLAVVPAGAAYDEYASAVVERNVLGRPSHVGRLRVLRHLRELYGLDAADAPFRVLRLLYASNQESLALLAGLLAVTRDEFLRVSWPALAAATSGERVTPEELARVLADEFDGTVSSATYAKAGRNVAASWAQTGHLVGRHVKLRRRVRARPESVAFALTLGHLSGRRGQALLETVWFALLDIAPGDVPGALDAAHRSGLVDVHRAGSVLEVDPLRLIGEAAV